MAREKKKRPPAVPGILIDEKLRGFRYEVKYDCPWCGKEHIVKLNDNPPVQILPVCGRGQVNLHRFEPPAEMDE